MTTTTDSKKLRDKDLKVLKAMHTGCWQCPIEFGGHADSPHVGILPKLIRHGLVKRKIKNTGPTGRKSYLYSLTEDGKSFIAEI